MHNQSRHTDIKAHAVHPHPEHPGHHGPKLIPLSETHIIILNLYAIKDSKDLKEEAVYP